MTACFSGGWPTFRFLKGGIPRAYPAWDLWILRMLARSGISVGTGEDEKEARRGMSPRLPTFAKNKGAKVDEIRAKARFELSMLLVRTKTAGQKGAFAHDDYRM